MQPSNETGSGAVTLSAAASGNPTPSVQWQLSSDGGATWLEIPNATSASYLVANGASAEPLLYRAVFTNGLGSVTSNAALVAANPETTLTQSGYIDYALPLGAMFNEVQASWIVPIANCGGGSSNLWASEWPGIGFGGDVIQDGTLLSCASSTPVWSAWWAIGGDPSITGGQPYLTYIQQPVKPGDAITASVGISGSTWTLSVTDATRPWTFSFTTPNTVPGLNQGAAMLMVEGNSACFPPTCHGLADFGAVHFTGATAELGSQTASLGSFSAIPVLTMNGSTLLAGPGALDPTGEDFTDTWYGN